MSYILRSMVDSDLKMVLEWRNRDDVRNNMYTNHIISTDEHRLWWSSQKSNPRSRLLICEIDGYPVGVVIFTNYTESDGSADWAFYSGDLSRKGIGTAMEIAALNYAFDELKVRKLNCEVLSFNQPVIQFHLKYGFQIEGVLREAYEREGKYYDIYKLAMFSRDWFKSVKPTIDGKANGAVNYCGKVFSRLVKVDGESVALFADAVKDHNPVHFDINIAKSLGFPGRIAHGMFSGSLFSGFFANEFPGPGTIYLAQTLEFIAPIVLGVNVDLRMRVLSHIGRKIVVETQIFYEEQLCLSGQAILLVPKILDRSSN